MTNFCNDTKAGKHGVNAQFWMNYINMVNIYMLFSRAVRTNDVELFCFMLEFGNNLNKVGYLSDCHQILLPDSQWIKYLRVQ